MAPDQPAVPDFQVSLHRDPFWETRRPAKLGGVVAAIVAVTGIFYFSGAHPVWPLIGTTWAIGAAMLLPGVLGTKGPGRHRLGTRSLAFWIFLWFLLATIVFAVIGEFCSSCHQLGKSHVMNALGTTVPNIVSPDVLAAASDGYLTATISTGRAGRNMPAWTGRDESLDDAAIAAIVSFLRGHEPAPVTPQEVAAPAPSADIALMYHLAHNAGHFLTEASVIMPVLSDPTGTGQDWFGTAGTIPSPLVSQGVIWASMIALVLIGHLWAVRALERAHRRLAGTRNDGMPWGGRVVLAAFLFAATASNLWLLAQPMQMRTGM